MIILSPEFHRNLWINFSPFRLIAMPVILAFLLWIFVIGEKNWASDLHALLTTLFFIIVFLWGNYAAASSLHSEIRNNTWDFQKMSSIGPWQLSLGKLFGATSYIWYFGIALLVIMAVGSFYDIARLAPHSTSSEIFFSKISIVKAVIYMILAGVMGHASAFLTSMQNFKYKGTGVVIPFIIGFLVSNIVYGVSLVGHIPNKKGLVEHINWHGYLIESQTFMILSILFFLFWMLIGIQRSMRSELQFRNSPVVWLLFMLTMAIYASGSVQRLTSWTQETLGAKLLLSYFLSLLLIYMVMLAEVIQPELFSKYKKCFLSLKSRRWKSVIIDMPAWSASLILILPLCLALNIYPNWTPTPNGPILLSLTVSALFFVVRDTIILHSVILTPKIRHKKFTIFIYYLMIYALLPLTALTFSEAKISLSDTETLINARILSIFFPTGEAPAQETLPIIFGQILLAGFLLLRGLKPLLQKGKNNSKELVSIT